MRIQNYLAAVALVVSGTASEAVAATSTANMNVSITITAGCAIRVSNINFGTISAANLVAAQTSSAAMGGLFTYTCSPGAAAPVLTSGQGANFSTTNRMKGAASAGFLPYSLTVPTLSTTITGAAQTAQIVATIPAQTTLPAADTYTDSVVLTLTY